MLTTEERVDRLEVVMDQFIAQVNTALSRLERMLAETNTRMERAQAEANERIARAQAEANERMDRLQAEANERMDRLQAEANARMDRLLAEMSERMERAQAEANARMDRMQAEANARMDHMQAEANERMDRLLAEMSERMERAIEEMRKERRELARQLGDLSNRLGTIVEDIIAPSLRRMAQAELDCGALKSFYIRAERWHPKTNQRREFDVIAVGDKAVLLNQTKATVKPEYATEFVEFLQRGEFFEYFPEYAGKPLIPVFSSLYLPQEIVAYLTRQKVFAVGMGEETMQVLNLAELKGA